MGDGKWSWALGYPAFFTRTFSTVATPRLDIAFELVSLPINSFQRRLSWSVLPSNGHTEERLSFILCLQSAFFNLLLKLGFSTHDF